MIKFIHTGDLHLGLKFQNVSFHKDKAIERRRELWSTFERIVKHAIGEAVDFLFIAGDLFEESYFTIGDITKSIDAGKGRILQPGIHFFNFNTIVLSNTISIKT